ncbi:hypothetical protein EDC01DRAFT_213278 [Geopyxis carbonaria]|nr:hypothetical protein EDC01DRAFT_213278 [Geopyxis carbonaria]
MSSPPPSYAASQAHCSTCARSLAPKDTNKNEKEKEKSEPRTAPLQQRCCDRWVCGECIDANPRFATYCAFCPSSSRLLPPVYSATPESESAPAPPSAPPSPPRADTLHHLHPTDTLPALALLYSVPPDVLRRHNKLYSDTLLPARRTLLIPGSHYAGASRSSTPWRGEAAEERERKVKRWQVRTKCTEPRAAEVYLAECKWDVDAAVERWGEDEAWGEREGGKGGKGVLKEMGAMGRVWKR